MVDITLEYEQFGYSHCTTFGSWELSNEP